MDTLTVILIAVGAVLVLFLLITYGCFWLAFYSPRRGRGGDGAFSPPPGKIYEPYGEIMAAWNRESRAVPHEDVSILSHDGITLVGKLYERSPDAPIELLMPGYRGLAERDLCGGVQRCFAMGRSLLMVEQRAGGDSGGRVISFGINESRDCAAWAHYLADRFGPDRPIYLGGISMGASTVLMAGALDLPDSVAGIMADCGYSTPRDIIRKVIAQLRLPVGICYFFVRLGGRLFGGFDIESASPLDAVKKITVPVVFIHGEADDFVPCSMSEDLYAACEAPEKRLLTVPGAGHGLAYLVEPEDYVNTLLGI